MAIWFHCSHFPIFTFNTMDWLSKASPNLCFLWSLFQRMVKIQKGVGSKIYCWDHWIEQRTIFVRLKDRKTVRKYKLHGLLKKHLHCLQEWLYTKIKLGTYSSILHVRGALSARKMNGSLNLEITVIVWCKCPILITLLSRSVKVTEILTTRAEDIIVESCLSSECCKSSWF